MIILLTLVTISLGNMRMLVAENWCWSLLGLTGLRECLLGVLPLYAKLWWWGLSACVAGVFLWRARKWRGLAALHCLLLPPPASPPPAPNKIASTRGVLPRILDRGVPRRFGPYLRTKKAKTDTLFKEKTKIWLEEALRVFTRLTATKPLLQNHFVNT